MKCLLREGENHLQLSPCDEYWMKFEGNTSNRQKKKRTCSMSKQINKRKLESPKVCAADFIFVTSQMR